LIGRTVIRFHEILQESEQKTNIQEKIKPALGGFLSCKRKQEISTDLETRKGWQQFPP